MEGAVVGVEGLQAHGSAYPHDSAAVLVHVQHEVARQGVLLAAFEAEGLEVETVETGEPVLSGNPYESASVLIDVVDLAVRQTVVGGVQSGHLCICRK